MPYLNQTAAIEPVTLIPTAHRATRKVAWVWPATFNARVTIEIIA